MFCRATKSVKLNSAFYARKEHKKSPGAKKPGLKIN